MYSAAKEKEESSQVAAERIDIKDLPVEQRIDIFKKSIKRLLGYDSKKSLMGKQRSWIAIYRVAADKGFIIEGDFTYFKQIIDSMQLAEFPVALRIGLLESSIKDIYAKHLVDWSDEHLTGRKLVEFKEVKFCADTFAGIVEENIRMIK